MSQPGPAGQLAGQIADSIQVVPDFPRAGIAFQDLAGVYARPALLTGVAAAIIETFGGFDRVLAVEARGFVLGAAVACLGARPLILARKTGKLPGAVHSVGYELEYGSAGLQLQRDAVRPGDRVLVIDDVLATGGTLAAAAELVTRSGGVIAGFAVAVHIAPLAGELRLRPAPVFAAVRVGPERDAVTRQSDEDVHITVNNMPRTSGSAPERMIQSIYYLPTPAGAANLDHERQGHA